MVHYFTVLHIEFENGYSIIIIFTNLKIWSQERKSIWKTKRFSLEFLCIIQWFTVDYRRLTFLEIIHFIIIIVLLFHNNRYNFNKKRARVFLATTFFFLSILSSVFFLLCVQYRLFTFFQKKKKICILFLRSASNNKKRSKLYNKMKFCILIIIY